MRYFPFINGNYSVAPGLSLMSKAVDERDKLIFQLDDQYNHYLRNKEDCRNENISKYYGELQFVEKTALCVNQYIASQLIIEHPSDFSLENLNGTYTFTNHKTSENLYWNKDWILTGDTSYNSLFDALCCQVQEDMAVCQLSDKTDGISAIHVCSPSHWNPSEKLGKSFNAIHAPVPGMEKTILNYFSILEAVVNKGPFSRFAWGLSSDNRLNHHPIAPPGFDPEEWTGRIYADTSRLFVRTERQTLIGFPACNAFLFTIRTYFYSINSLPKEDKQALMKAVESMSDEALAYKGLSGRVDTIRNLLNL